MEKISITRALSELKLLDARIKKEIANTLFIDVYQGRADNAMISNCTKAEFETKTVAKMQSITDLIERRGNIKSAILLSNSKINVKIGSRKMFVVEAIDRKNSIQYERNLLDKMRADSNGVKKNVETNRAQLNEQINNMVEQSLGTEKKVDRETYSQIADPINSANEVKILDPIKIEKRIEKLDKDIDEFLSEVDFVLSESNSRTEIEI